MPNLNYCFPILLLLIAVTACSKSPEATTTAGAENGGAPSASPPVLTAATLGDQELMTSAEFATSEPFVSADRTNGERQAQICRACHSLQEGGPNMIGPALHGFFGRAAGGQAGFNYSAAITDADFVWTPRALDAWLIAPGRFLPGNSMVFPGVMNEDDRTDLIAYLLAATAEDSTQPN